MTTRYQKNQIEDVARILRERTCGDFNEPSLMAVEIMEDFADLFAADNPMGCAECGRLQSAAPKPCPSGELHRFTWGFDRWQFLAACRLEEEQS
ncbi:hypothetical protein LCGC14_1682620 [marine sediment metagenome]|uniref:Uncharacterized protein n=1 Tax=marine sediment metagenome TaxID=412755 RepID=A0A0F9IAL0_9ZZZZ